MPTPYVPALGRRETELVAFAGKELMWNLDEDAGAVAGFWIAAAGAAMRQVQQHLNSLADDVVTFMAANAGDKADAAGVVLVRGIVETLRGGQAIFSGLDASSWTSSGGLNSFRITCSSGLPREGDGGSHTSAQEQTFGIFNVACGRAKYNAEFRCKPCKIQGCV